jgi:hypothetical protein
MELSLARVADYTRAIDAAGIDVHLVGGNAPGGFLGRRNYEQHILAYERRQIQLAQGLPLRPEPSMAWSHGSAPACARGVGAQIRAVGSSPATTIDIHWSSVRSGISEAATMVS